MDVVNEKQKHVENFLREAFSNITDQYGQKLSIAPALPNLVQVTLNYESPLAKRFRFLGEGARAMAICWIISSMFPEANLETLTEHNRKCQDPGRISKSIFGQMQFKRSLGIPTHSNLFDAYIGVLYHFFGMPAVRGFIEPGVKEIFSNPTTVKALTPGFKPVPNQDPKSQIREVLVLTGGNIQIDIQGAENSMWQATVICQLVQSGTIFSHSRIGPSKQKASTAACYDILEYLHNHVDIRTQLMIPNCDTSQVHRLNIPESEWCKVVDNLKTIIDSKVVLDNHPNKANWVHLPATDDQEETIRQLQLLLLGNGNPTNEIQPTRTGHFDTSIFSRPQQ
ncbi:unnamed protein product [Rhizopus microsporus]